jgi:hypothetical protein
MVHGKFSYVHGFLEAGKNKAVSLFLWDNIGGGGDYPCILPYLVLWFN